jgi:N-acyl amino acid synthase of PEP-CTERM/exosortase system
MELGQRTEPARIVEDFRQYFVMVTGKTPALREESFRIRYQVYAEELGWEDKSRFPDGCETDEYDQDAATCLLQHRPSGQFIGCVRLVLVPLGKPLRFPFENVVAPMAADLATYGAGWRANAGEISRVAVISRFRRRTTERERPDNIPEEVERASPERRVFPHIAVGLYLGAAALALSRGLNRVFAIMEPRLARRLRAYGIEFEVVGQPVEHHGVRVPYCLTALFETISEDLAL